MDFRCFPRQQILMEWSIFGFYWNSGILKEQSPESTCPCHEFLMSKLVLVFSTKCWISTRHSQSIALNHRRNRGQHDGVVLSSTPPSGHGFSVVCSLHVLPPSTIGINGCWSFCVSPATATCPGFTLPLSLC